MSNKRLKIENLENLQEVTTEEFSSIQGGLSVINIHEQIIIGPDHPIEWKPKPLPLPHPTPLPHPLPVDCYPKPIPYPIPCYTGLKEHEISIHFKIHWCPVAL